MALRRPPAADPHVLARVAAPSVPGWVPPEDEPEAVTAHQPGAAGRVAEPGGPAAALEREGKRGALGDTSPPALPSVVVAGLLGPWRQGRIDPGRRGLARSRSSRCSRSR